jgi:uncharacterized membrane protein YedE/YeeE
VTAPGREAQSAEHPSTIPMIGGVSLGVAAQLAAGCATRMASRSAGSA